MAGSIGDGKTRTPARITQPPHTPGLSEVSDLASDIEALYNRYGTPTDTNLTTPTAAPGKPRTPVGYNAPLQIPTTHLHGVYTEYLANIEQLELDDLDDMTGPYNWADLIDNIKTNGIQEPIEIGVDENGDQYIINGCHRAVVALRLQLEHVPVIYRRD